MYVFSSLRRQGALNRARCVLFVLALSSVCGIARAAIIRGTVTDTLGGSVSGAAVVLFRNGKAITSAATGPDGVYQFSTGNTGRFYVVVSGETFRQLQTPVFYAGRLDNIERNVVLEPSWVRQQVVVTATGMQLPQAQSSASIQVISPLDLNNRLDLVDTLRLAPGNIVVQTGQRGSQTSLFVRGGGSDSNKVTVDGISAEDVGGRFDFANLSSTGVEHAEVYRGPNSSLYGSDAAAGVVAIESPHGTTVFPSLMYSGEAGTYSTLRNDVGLAGAFHRLDYLGDFSRFDTANSIPNNQYHVATSVANLGYQAGSKLNLRGTVRYGVSAVGLPGAYTFYQLSNDGKQNDQDLYTGGTIEYQTTDSWHNLVRYGAARKREQSKQWYAAGILFNGNYYGKPVVVKGANGYQVQGRALLNYSEENYGIYPNSGDLDSNSDQVFAQSDYRITPHITALFAFRYTSERASERYPAYSVNEKIDRGNYDYTMQLAGDWKNRLFYNLGGGIQDNALYGIQGTPRIGIAFYVQRPGDGIAHGTKLSFNFAKGVKEPTMPDQLGSLYTFLSENGYSSSITEFNISPIGAERARTWEGGIDQSFFSQRLLASLHYFHNIYGNQIESVPAQNVPDLIPGLTADQRAALLAELQEGYAGSLYLNSQDYSAQGIEFTAEYGLGHNVYFRGGYTWLDARIERSFSSDALTPTYNTGLSTGPVPSFSNIPIGVYSPLRGARPFRRPPHSGFVSASYSSRRFTAVATAAFASRSDDSTFMAYMDEEQGNSLLLPNRNLDPAFAKIDLGGSFQLKSWMSVYTQAENLANSTHIAPIGYVSLPFTLRGGMHFSLGHAKK